MDENHKVIKDKEGVFAIMETSGGDIVLELYYKDTPLTVTNFVGLAEGTLDAANGKPFYDGLTFHRVISNFMIQGGDPNGDGSGGPGYTFPDECLDKYQFTGAGILAMANAGSGVDGLGTNGSQFFITHTSTSWLNGQHTIFGKLVKGQDVVNEMKQGDKIIHIEIVRQGVDAEAFTATQADFDRLKEEVTQKKIEEVKAQKEAAAAAVATTLEWIEQNYTEAVKTPQNIFYQILEEGEGEKCGMGKRALVEYQAMFLDGQVFDSTQNSGPLEMYTALGNIIPGFDLMVQDMKAGETRFMIIPPDYAYGDKSVGGVIPAYSFLVFIVRLNSFTQA